MTSVVFFLQKDAVASGDVAARRAHLHVVKGGATSADAAPAQPAGVAPRAARVGERALLEQWRDAHWSLRLRLQEVVRDGAHRDLQQLYDLARRADNQLTDFYQERAEHLARRLRGVLMARVPESNSSGGTTPPSDAEERALLAAFRVLAPRDRESILQWAAAPGGGAAARDTVVSRAGSTESARTHRPGDYIGRESTFSIDTGG